MSLRDEFVVNVLSELQNDFTSEQLGIIENTLIQCISDYELTDRVTDIVPFDSFIPKWYGIFIARKKIAGRSMGTLKLYNKYITNFFLDKPAPLDEMDGTLMLRYLYDLQQRTHISNRTLDQVRIILGTFFEWAASEGYVKHNFVSAIDPIKYIETPRQPLTDEEVCIVRDACDTYRERAIVDVLLYTGIRISELVNMKWSDINMQERTIRIFGKGSKYRTVFFNSQAKVSLLQYKLVRKGNSEYVFVSEHAPYNQIKKGAVGKIIKSISERADINAEITAHVFRHTFATHAIARGMPIEKLRILMGHENFSTTEIYAKIDLSQVAYEYKKCYA